MNKNINPNLRKLAELTYNPNLKVDKSMFEKQEQIQLNSTPLDDFIYVSSINIQFAKQRTHLNKNWHQTQKALQSEGLSMPTPYQFIEFLKYLRDNPSNENTEVYNEIIEVRGPWRSNWLNARFEKRKNELYMISENVLDNGIYKTIETKLTDVLMKDKTPGISFNEWLNSDEKHGLPKSRISKGDLYYWCPRNNSVARFDANSGGAYLGCYWGPSVSGASLGVYAARAKKL